MIWIAASIGLQLGALVLLKLIAQQGRPDLWHTVTHPLFAAAFAVLVLQSLVWQLALRRYPLNAAYTWQALLFPAALAIGVAFFGDALAWNKLAGVLLIVGGVAWHARAP
jgi:multidrug transporter EmrE-like cation transporter